GYGCMPHANSEGDHFRITQNAAQGYRTSMAKQQVIAKRARNDAGRYGLQPWRGNPIETRSR
ncbi:MAG: hypothetical protein ACREOX_10130, partial [Stenotrophomonas sp.]